MGVDPDEFSGDDPNSFDTARAAADAPIGDPLNPEARAGDEPPADAATDGKSNGNGAAHVDGKFTAGAEDSASEPSAPATQLCPNRADINKHLCALFHPDFVSAIPTPGSRSRPPTPRLAKARPDRWALSTFLRSTCKRRATARSVRKHWKRQLIARLSAVKAEKNQPLN